MKAPSLEALQRRLDRLERQNRCWRGLALLLLAAMTGLGLFQGARPIVVEAQQRRLDVGDPGEPAPLFVSQVKMAQRALEIIDDTISIGAPVPNPSSVVFNWSYRMLSAELFATTENDPVQFAEPEVYLSQAKGDPVQARVRSLEKHLARMKQWEARFRPLAEGSKFSLLDFLEIQARRLQAEQWLARELHKPKRG